MASHDITIRGIKLRLTPLSSQKGYEDINVVDRLILGRSYVIYRYDCSKTPPGGPIPQRWPVPADTDFRELNDLNGPQANLKSKAKFADFIMATDLAPSGWRRAVDAAVGPMPVVTLNPREILARYSEYKFDIAVGVDYAYMIARPQLTAAQRRNPLLRAIGNRYVLIGIPTEVVVTINYRGRCNPNKPTFISRTIAKPKITIGEGLKPLIEEHEQNLKKLDEAEGLMPLPWGGGFNHDELEPDPEEPETEPADPEEKPLNPFEEFMFDLYEFIELAEVFADLEQNPPTPEELGED